MSSSDVLEQRRVNLHVVPTNKICKVRKIHNYLLYDTDLKHGHFIHYKMNYVYILCLSCAKAMERIYSYGFLAGPPTTVVYDNTCNLFEYCLNRDPIHFKETIFLVDGLHWPNHKRMYILIDIIFIYHRLFILLFVQVDVSCKPNFQHF